MLSRDVVYHHHVPGTMPRYRHPGDAMLLGCHDAMMPLTSIATGILYQTHIPHLLSTTVMLAVVLCLHVVGDAVHSTVA